jgi:hypothetical protein
LLCRPGDPRVAHANRIDITPICRPARNELNIVNCGGGVNQNQARSPSVANGAAAHFHPAEGVQPFEMILKNF